jgi:hypothetical protein
MENSLSLCKASVRPVRRRNGCYATPKVFASGRPGFPITNDLEKSK